MRRSKLPGISGKSGLLGLLSAVVMIVSGCAGIPKFPEDWLPADALPPTCRVYLSLKVPGNEELVGPAVKKLSDDDLINEGIKRTEYLYLGLEGFGAKDSFYATARGSYPTTLAGMGLTFSSQWKKQRGTFPWYLHTLSSLQVSFPRPFIFCVTNGDLSPLLDSLKTGERRLAEPVRELMNTADIGIYIPRFEDQLVRLFLPEGTSLPAEKLRLRMIRQGQGYLMDLNLDASGEREAKALASVLRLLLLNRAKKNTAISLKEFMKTTIVSVEGSQVGVSGVLFSVEELLALLEKVLPTGKEETP
ncbi:MAG: hypothetical protein JW760_11315 [Spirochaetales bacterium]|nr:hypothetical protein [Spirochaetales bacterium]